MDKVTATRFITDLHFDIDNLFNDWEKGKISDELTIEKIANLCKHFLITIFGDDGKE